MASDPRPIPFCSECHKTVDLTSLPTPPHDDAGRYIGPPTPQSEPRHVPQGRRAQAAATTDDILNSL